MSNDLPDPKETAARLLAYLRRLRNDRGAMADLRCALNPNKLPRAWPLLGRVGGIGNPRIEAVAGLFAYHPDEAHSGNLGTTCRRLAAENNSFDARFQRLLACDRDEICERLASYSSRRQARRDTDQLRGVIRGSLLLGRQREGPLGAGILGRAGS